MHEKRNECDELSYRISSLQSCNEGDHKFEMLIKVNRN